MLNFIWLIFLLIVVFLVSVFSGKKKDSSEKKPKPGDEFNSMMSRKLSDEEIEHYMSFSGERDYVDSDMDSDYISGMTLSAMEGDPEALEELHERFDD